MALVLLFLVVLFSNSISQAISQNHVKRVEILHPQYTVEWEVNLEKEIIEFIVTAETKGFIGFGLSHNGAMMGADIVIGGVDDNGKEYFQDYHGIGNKFPELDSQQNWLLSEASEEGNTTMLRFSRVWDTCDDDDVVIDKGTVHLIWSFGSTDEIQYHGSMRGGLAVNLLDPPSPPLNLTEVTHEITEFYTLDGRDTAYWCSIHRRIPEKKTQIIAFKPKLESPEALEYTHHFNIYVCKAPVDQSPHELFDHLVDLDAVNCWDKNDIVNARPHCSLGLYAWSFGGRVLTLPEDVGFPWGEDAVEYYLFETHVDNPNKRTNITFETGVQFYETENLREKNAALVAVAYATSMSLFIPPEATDWTVAGHGSSFCTKETIPATGIHLFNVNLHAHISAKKMLFRHFRNGTELPWIAKDDYYDFNYQENRPLIEEVTVLPGDHLTIECVFDNTWKSSPYPVIGGYPSTDEMCMVFAFYYPNVNLDWYYSVYPIPQLVGRYGITNITDVYETYPSLDSLVIDPLEWRGQKVTEILNSTVNWTTAEIDSLQKELRFGIHNDGCPIIVQENGETVKHSNSFHSKFFIPYFNPLYDNETDIVRPVSYPQINKVYEEIRKCPLNKHNHGINKTPFGFLFYAFILLGMIL